jgi:uncharacterized membrane protein
MKGKAMERIEHSEIVDEPVHAVYERWTRMQEFGGFMDGLKSVQQVAAGQYEWRAQVGGRDTSWQADIVEDIPNQRIVWRSTGSGAGTGKVEFIAQGANRTVVKLELEFQPEGSMATTQEGPEVKDIVGLAAAELGATDKP